MRRWVKRWSDDAIGDNAQRSDHMTGVPTVAILSTNSDLFNKASNFLNTVALFMYARKKALYT